MSQIYVNVHQNHDLIDTATLFLFGPAGAEAQITSREGRGWSWSRR